jgi:hypothetical protein
MEINNALGESRLCVISIRKRGEFSTIRIAEAARAPAIWLQSVASNDR